MAQSIYGQQVDPLSGRLDYSVSLGGIQSNDLSVSVSIHSSGSSIQVAQGEGSCGVGWGLSAGGSITRQVRGLPDEHGTNGWKSGSGIATAVNNFNPVADDDLSNCTDSNETTDYNGLVVLTGSEVNPTKDTEPDLFFVSAPGLAAQFVFGTDGQPKWLTHQDLKIETNSFPSSIIITNPAGIVYTFSQQETVSRKGITASANQANTLSRYYATEVTFVGRWHLASITSATTGTAINFAYTTLQEVRSTEFLTSDSTNYITDAVVPKRISSITLKTYSITFNWLNNLLTSVNIAESETQDSRKYTLEYRSSSSGTFHKAFLARVNEENNCVPFSTVEFEYKDVLPGQSVSPPWTNNHQQDFFGFYNGVTANKNNPTLYLYTGESNGRRLRATPIPGGSPTEITGDNRAVSDTHNGFGALTKIKFPTGGFVEIEYEPNVYLDGTTSEELKGAGVRVKRITRQGSEVAFGKTLDSPSTYRATRTEYQYKLANNLSSGVLISPIKLGYITSTGVQKSVTNLGDDPAVLYTRITEIIPGQGKRVMEYSVPGVFPDTVSGNWSAARSRIARKPTTPCLSIGNVKNGYYIFPYAPSSNSTKRGLLTKVSEYSEMGVPVRERTETTTELTSSPTTIKAVRFERVNDIYHYSVYKIETGRVEAPYQTKVREASELDPSQWMETTTTYGYNANNMVSQVTTALPDGTVRKRYTKYAKDFAITSPTSSDTMAVAVKKLRDQYRHGQVIEETSTVTVPGGTETTAGSALTLFREFSTNRVLPSYSLISLPGIAITASTATSSSFTYDNGDYLKVAAYKAYDNEGRLLAQQDDKRNTAGYHYATNTSTPLMTIAMAHGQQCVYEGFEQAGSFGLSATGAVVVADGWTGEKAARFLNGTDKLTSSSINLIEKGANLYRISCWVKAASGKTVTFTAKQGASSVSGNLTVSSNNLYAYLEGTLNVSSLTGPFTLEVTTSATTGSAVIIDDIVFVPSQARISFQSLKPFKGVTYSTDDRGNSVKRVFDDGGRLILTYDKDRNLVSKNEYLNKQVMTPSISAMFTASVTEFVAGTAITFTANNPCGSSVNRVWYVDGTAQNISQPATSLNWTFSTAGVHTVKLIVSTAEYGSSSFTQTICVEPGLGVTVQPLDGSGNPYSGPLDCNFTGTVRFTAKQASVWYKGTYDQTRNEWTWTYYSTDPPPAPSISVDYFMPATTVLKAVPILGDESYGCSFTAWYYSSNGSYTFTGSNCN